MSPSPGAAVPPGDPGRPVRVVMTKWGERPHWEFDGLFLGSDGHGDWLGFPTGTRHARPGAQFVSSVDAVTLLPRTGAFAATFHRPGVWVDIYVDIATPPVWDGSVVRSIDLDLDVVRLPTGQVYVDDEDEFAEHRVRFGYPEDVVALAESTCARVRRAVLDAAAPFDGTAAPWLARLGGLTAT